MILISLRWAGLAAVFFSVGALTASLLRRRAADEHLVIALTRLGAGGPGDTIRDVLRRALSDPGLEIIYPRFGRGGWVNALGEATTGAVPDVARAFTPIDRGGKPIAGILHDRALLRRPERLRAAIDAASYALDNERLKADLRAQLLEAQMARARILDAADRELQRLERNLHDGAQQRLVGLALMLRLASRSAAGDPSVTALLDDAAGELDDALAELRKLTRGIHPAIVGDAGLGDALETLAERPGVPVELHVDLPGRLREAVEVAAYYVVAEALTNTNKHAQAQLATVSAVADDDLLRLTVTDDGVGGAAPGRQSGLEGLADRVGALGGRLVVDSRAGAGTTITAEIPLAVAAGTEGDRRRMTALQWIGCDRWEMPPEAFEQITDEDNLLSAKATMLCGGGNAQLTEPERAWLLGYQTAAGSADWVLEAIEVYDDGDTLTELMEVPGFPEIARGQLYDALWMCAADGPLTPEEIGRVETAAQAMGFGPETVTVLHELVLEAQALRRRRFEAIAAPVLPHGPDAERSSERATGAMLTDPGEHRPRALPGYR